MRWLTTSAMVIAAVLMLSTAASGGTFADWASSQGYNPGDAMPTEVWAYESAIDSLDGIGEFSWTETEKLLLRVNRIPSIESGDFDGLTNLRALDMGGNQLSSIEPGDFDGLTNLSEMDLNSNQISSIDSGHFSELTNLTWLRLQYNWLTSIESDSLSGLTNLSKLYLYGNRISSIESGAFSGLTNLSTLMLHDNRLPSIESGAFSGMTNLTDLRLNDNRISSLESGAFSGLTNLRSLRLWDNQISNIESGAFSGLTNLSGLSLRDNIALTELNLAAADFTGLDSFDVENNVNIASVSLKNAMVNQTSLAVLLDGGATFSIGIGEVDGITEMDLSGIDFGNITDLGPLYVMDDLTDLWLVDTVNLNASDLDALLNNLATIQGTATEGVLYMTQANYDAFGPLLDTWDGEFGHHVEFVVPGDFDSDGDVDGGDFLAWQRGESHYPLSSSDLDEWQDQFGTGVSPLSAANAKVPEPTTSALALAATLCLALGRRRARWENTLRISTTTIRGVVTSLLLLVCLVAKSNFCEAAPVFFSDRGAFDAAVPVPLTEELFESSFADAPSVQFNGFSISVANGNLRSTSSLTLVSQGSGASTDATPFNQIFTFVFDVSTRAFGVDINDFGTYGGNHSITATSDTGTFVTHVIAWTPPALPAGNTIFFGVIDDSPFNSVTIDRAIGTDRIGLDFAVHSPLPEPTTSALALAATLCLALGRRRGR